MKQPVSPHARRPEPAQRPQVTRTRQFKWYNLQVKYGSSVRVTMQRPTSPHHASPHFASLHLTSDVAEMVTCILLCVCKWGKGGYVCVYVCVLVCVRPTEQCIWAPSSRSPNVKRKKKFMLLQFRDDTGRVAHAVP